MGARDRPTAFLSTPLIARPGFDALHRAGAVSPSLDLQQWSLAT